MPTRIRSDAVAGGSVFVEFDFKVPPVPLAAHAGQGAQGVDGAPAPPDQLAAIRRGQAHAQFDAILGRDLVDGHVARFVDQQADDREQVFRRAHGDQPAGVARRTSWRTVSDNWAPLLTQ